MPIGYGYQASGDAGYVNWAAVTKGFTDVLEADIKDKELREKNLEEKDREISKKLAEAPFGQFDDGNIFLNNVVDIAKGQTLMDARLFKSGRLSEKQRILKQNNLIDNIKTLFDVQKKFQEASDDRMKGLATNKYQALTLNVMKKLDDFKNFKDSVPVIDPTTNIISIAKKTYNEKTKTWDIDKSNTMPVNMAMNLIMNPAETYNVDADIDKDVARMGTLKNALYQAATMTKAGTITNLLGPEGFKNYPQAAGVINEFNKAVNDKIEQYLTPSLNLTSILTQNTNKYDDDSFVYTREEAEKDPTKILMKIDPVTKYPEIDKTGPNYEKQKKEAADWVRTQFMSRIDREMTIQTVGQLSDVTLPRETFGYTVTQQQADAKTLGTNLMRLATGSPSDVENSFNYLKQLNIDGYKDADGKIYLKSKGATDYSVFDPSKTSIEKFAESVVSGAKSWITERELNEGDVVSFAKQEGKGKNYVKGAYGGPVSKSTQAGYNEQALNEYLDENVTGGGPRGVMANRTIIPNNGSQTAANLNAKFNKMNIRFESKSGGMFGSDFIKIKDAAGNDISDWINLGDQKNVSNIKDIIKANIDQSVLPSVFPAPSKQPASSAAGGVNLNASQIKSQFGGVFQ